MLSSCQSLQACSSKVVRSINNKFSDARWPLPRPNCTLFRCKESFQQDIHQTVRAEVRLQGSDDASSSVVETHQPSAKVLWTATQVSVLVTATAFFLGLVQASPSSHPIVSALANAASSAFMCTCVLFCGYLNSWLIDSRDGQMKHFGDWFNLHRKDVCRALQVSHGLLLAAVIAWLVSIPILLQVPASTHLPQLKSIWALLESCWPVVFVGSINIIILAGIELGRRLTRKARILQLDAEGPGRAHPIMVQGVQTAAKGCVWISLAAVSAVLAWLDVGRTVCCAALIVLAGSGLATLTVEEAAVTEMTAPMSAVTKDS